MRKQRFRTIMVLLIVIFSIAMLSACDEDEMMTVSAHVPSFRHVEIDGTTYTEIDVEVTVVNNVEDKDITNCKYKLYFKDTNGNIVECKEMDMPGTAASGESLSDYETHTVVGIASLDRAVPVSFDAVEGESFGESLTGSGIIGVILVVGFLWWALKD